MTEPRTSAQLAAAAASCMDSIIGRLTYDKAFASALANNPREALAHAGLELDKEGVEALLAIDPERFDQACEALFDLVDSDFLHKLVMPSCGQVRKPPRMGAENVLAGA